MTDVFAISGEIAWIDAQDGLGLDLDECYVAKLPAGPPLLLKGSARSVWHGIDGGGTLEEIVQRTAALSGSPAELIADDVRRFVDSLVDGALVVRTRVTDDA